MMHGKKPTYTQRQFLDNHGLNSRDWWVLKDTSTEMVIRHREDPELVKIINKE